MQYVYGTLLLISLLLFPIYYVLSKNKQNELNLFVLFGCVSIVNLGYFLISISKTVQFALLANKIAYLGQVLIPMCMFMIILRKTSAYG